MKTCYYYQTFVGLEKILNDPERRKVNNKRPNQTHWDEYDIKDRSKEIGCQFSSAIKKYIGK